MAVVIFWYKEDLFIMESKNEVFFSTITLEELKNKSFFIFGVSKAKDLLIQMLNIPYHLIGYCDNNSALWGTKIDNIPVYSPQELQDYTSIHKECCIIIASAFEYEIYPQLVEELNIKNKIYLIDQIFPAGFQYLFEKSSKHSSLSKNELIKQFCKTQFLTDNKTIVNNTKELAVYSAPKVGSTTLTTALGYHFRAHTVFFLFHSMDRPQFTSEQKQIVISKVKKIITGVRDAVSQNISLIYQFPHFHCLSCGSDGHNAQKVFDYYIADSIINEKKRRLEGSYGYQLEYRAPFLMQSWHDDTLKPEFGIDLYKYPFDKENGYSIYKINNYEILVYQMEKMDKFYDIFRDFIGDPSLIFQKTNDSQFKWYAESYDRFKKNVVLDKEYIRKTYSGKMMKHFYSDLDIKKFKRKWENNIVE